MSTSGEKDSERSSRQRGSTECKSLIDAATKDLFRKNAFRITGLPVDASVRDISKHENRLTQMTELGLGESANTSAFALKPPPDLDQLHKAHRNLKDPEKRMVDEFFWFWPEEFGQSRSDPAIQALQAGYGDTAFDIWTRKETNPKNGVVAMHNIALVWHLTALEWEGHAINAEFDADRQTKLEGYWRNAFKRWEQLVLNDELWEKVTTRIRQINEPDRLPPGFARRMRTALPGALGKINAELALAFAESGKIELARLHIRFMREINQGLYNVEKTAELVLTPTKNRLKEQIQRARDCVNKNPRDAAKVALELLGQAGPTLTLFDLFFGKDNELRNDLFDEVAAVCNRLQIVYYKETGDDKTCLEILKAILPFATSTDLRQSIEKDISETCARLELLAVNKKFEPVYTLLKSIQDSKASPCIQLARFERDVIPAIVKAAGISGLSQNHGYLSAASADYKDLFDSVAIVLRGISLDAWNNHQDRRTAVAANELAVKHATSPELKQRLAEDKATLQQMGAQMSASAAAQREKSNNTGVGCLVVVAIFIVLGIIGSCNSTNTSSSNSSYMPPPTPTAPAYTPPPTVGNPANKTYRVPSSVSSTLDDEKTKIESERITLEALDAQVEGLGREIERDRPYLDRTSQFAVDEFNAKVGRYNALAQKAKLANAAFNQKVDNYNTKLRQYGR